MDKTKTKSDRVSREKTSVNRWAIVLFVLICLHGSIPYVEPVARSFGSGFVACFTLIFLYKFSKLGVLLFFPVKN